MSRRYKPNQSVARRAFTRDAMREHPLNGADLINYRGGIRL